MIQPSTREPSDEHHPQIDRYDPDSGRRWPVVPAMTARRRMRPRRARARVRPSRRPAGRSRSAPRRQAGRRQDGAGDAAPARRGKKADDAPEGRRPEQGRHSQARPARPPSCHADELAAIKELPAAEQDAAIAQAVCPVSTHNLGSMGKPLKVTAEGRTFYLCCESCEKESRPIPRRSSPSSTS